MLRPVLILASIYSVHSSGVGHQHTGAIGPVPVGSVANGPVVTASSSQYFERTFNRLVAAPPVLQPVIPVAPPPPVFVQPLPNTIPALPAPPQVLPAPPPQVIPAPPQVIPVQPQADPIQPNVAIAVATAHAAAPVATILLPPYPFGLPPGFGFIPSGPPFNVPEEKPRESTTPSTTTTQTEATTTEREPEVTTPESSSSDNNFIQALPSNENINFNQVYGPPLPPQQHWPQQRPQGPPLPRRQPFPQQQEHPYPQGQPQSQHHLPQGQPLPLYNQKLPQGQPIPPQQYQQPWQQRPQQNPHIHWQQKGRPQKLRTTVEVVKAPLAYIAPPPLRTHEHVKLIKHVYGFAPTKSKIIIRTIRTPGHIVTYRIPVSAKSVRPYSLRAKDIELTTLRNFPRPNTKPPRV